MYTGLIQQMACLVSLVKRDRYHLMALCCEDAGDLQVGQSIAIDGMCVTVTSREANTFYCHISEESLAVTRAGTYCVGDRLNVERPLLLTQRLEGHFVTGHIDQVARIFELESSETGCLCTVTGVLSTHHSYLVPKGSIALNGVSLTVNRVLKDGFTVMLIPHTLAHTNLETLVVGDCVNVEFDLLLKAVHAQLAAKSIEEVM